MVAARPLRAGRKMRDTFTRKYTDESTEDEYVFTFCCDICGKPYRASAVCRGNKKGLFRGREYRRALRAAWHEAELHFNRCPCCSAWVCDDDFDMSVGRCKACEDEGKKKGSERD